MMMMVPQQFPKVLLRRLVVAWTYLEWLRKIGQVRQVITQNDEKSAQRDANTVCMLAVVRIGHCPPTRCHKPTDRTDYNTLPQLASTQCKNCGGDGENVMVAVVMV